MKRENNLKIENLFNLAAYLRFYLRVNGFKLKQKYPTYPCRNLLQIKGLVQFKGGLCIQE